jgi:hypothetical protein
MAVAYVNSTNVLNAGFFARSRPTEPSARHIEIDDATLEGLLDGIDVEAPRSPRRTRVH